MRFDPKNFGLEPLGTNFILNQIAIRVKGKMRVTLRFPQVYFNV